MLSATQTFQLYNRDIQNSLQIVASDPTTYRETEYFEKNITNIETVEEFVSDYRLFSYAMKAHNLDDMIFAKGYMRKILSESIYDSNSIVNRLTDPRFREFAKAFNFGDVQGNATKLPSVIPDTKERYYQLELEKRAGEQNEGARLALYFQRKADSINSISELFADKAIYQVIQSTYRLPVSSGASLDSLIRTVENQIDLNDIKDPSRRNVFLSKFIATWDATHNTISSSTSIALLTAPIGPSQPLLLDLQKLYR